MAYKFNLGTFKLAGTLDMEGSTEVKHKDSSIKNDDLAGQINLFNKAVADTPNSYSKIAMTGQAGDHVVSADEVGTLAFISNSKLCQIVVAGGSSAAAEEFGTLNKAALIIEYANTLPVNNETVVFTHNSKTFTVTFKTSGPYHTSWQSAGGSTPSANCEIVSGNPDSTMANLKTIMVSSIFTGAHNAANDAIVIHSIATAQDFTSEQGTYFAGDKKISKVAAANTFTAEIQWQHGGITDVTSLIDAMSLILKDPDNGINNKIGTNWDVVKSANSISITSDTGNSNRNLTVGSLPGDFTATFTNYAEVIRFPRFVNGSFRERTSTELLTDLIGPNGLTTVNSLLTNYTAGDIVYASADGQTLSRFARGSDNQVMVMNGSALNWEKITAGSLDVADNGSNGQVLTSDGDGTFSWTAKTVAIPDTNLTNEEVQDIVGGMLGGTEDGISVTYNDGDNDIDFTVSITTGNIAANSLQVASEGLGSSDTALATAATIKNYVDGVAQGLDIKESCKAADNAASDLTGLFYTADPATDQTAPPTLQLGSSAGQNLRGNFDGHILGNGDRVLIKGYSGNNRYKNGIYKVTTPPTPTMSSFKINFTGSQTRATAAGDQGDFAFSINTDGGGAKKYFKVTIAAGSAQGVWSGTGADSGNHKILTVGRDVGGASQLGELIGHIAGKFGDSDFTGLAGGAWDARRETNGQFQQFSLSENNANTLMKDFADTSENITNVADSGGIATANFATGTRGVLTREALAQIDGGLSDGSAPLTPGAFTFIEQGSTQANKGYVMSENGALSANNASNPIEFTQFSGAGSVTLGSLSVTADANELNLNDGALAGTAVASKSVIYDSAKRVVTDGLVVKTQILTGGQANTTLVVSDGAVVILDTNGGNQTLTLPDPSTIVDGQRLVIKRKDSSAANTMTISKHASASANTIEGASTILLEAGGAITLIADNTSGNGRGWWII